MFRDLNYWVGILVWLNFNKPVRFNPIAGSLIGGKDKFEIRKHASQSDNPDRCKGNLHK